MNINRLIRQFHRWLSIIFMAAVAVATYAAATGQGAESALYYLPLPPLFLLMASGIYMFALPYFVRWRGQTAGGRSA